MISERDWLRAARELPEDELLCCPYSNCLHMDQGLDAMRSHICSAHLSYFPFKCQLCEEQLPFCSRPQFEQQHNCAKRDGPAFHQCQAIEHYDEAMEAQLHIETGEVVKARMLEKEEMKRVAEEKEAEQAVASSNSKTEAHPDKSEHPPPPPPPPSTNGYTAATELISKGGFGARNSFRRARASVTEIHPAKSERPPPSPSSPSGATVEVIKGSFGMRVNFRRSGGGPAA